MRTVEQRQGGSVDLLGSLFKIDGVAPQTAVAAPLLGEHTNELLEELAKAGAAASHTDAPSTTPIQSDLGGPHAI